MSDKSSPKSNGTPATATILTPAQRIAELNDIDQSLATLLMSASEAIGVLANKRNDAARTSTYGAQEAKFQESSRTYFATLSSIEVGLKRQVYALEEAGLIQPGEERDNKKARAIIDRRDDGGGHGPLDSSWLNARADNGVQDGLERQILAEAKQFLATEKNKAGSNRNTE